ncbi:endolytic transglycosylase MltG, partial [Streptomyces erythrochromogenes]|uniref:endolytic transglycosylase MltG n=1 Tax=Streptomyces erythrochromogenes TaxID=285574 RepID=UPI00369D83DB
MTEYGRGRGPEPWHPEDPLYGDQGWTGHQTQQGQVPYAGAPQQEYQQEPQYQQQHPQQPQYQEYQQYPEYQQQYAQQQPQQGYAPQQAQQQYAQPQQGYAPQQQYAQQPDQPQQPAYDSQGWDTGQGQYTAAVQTDPYAGANYAQQPSAGYPGEAPDLYSTEEAYPPPQPPGRRHLEPEPVEQEEEPESILPVAGGGRDGEDDGDESNGRRGGRSKGGKPKQRSGMACLIAAVVILGVVGGGGYYGYSYIKARFAPAEDFAGEGAGEVVDVEIPKGAGLGQMGRILKEAGVVASAQAFVDAANANPKGKSIQPGVYPMNKKMSGAAAVALMIDPTKLNVITVTEGMRNSKVYEAIDKKLGKPEGTTKEIAQREAKNLGRWGGGGASPPQKPHRPRGAVSTHHTAHTDKKHTTPR